MKAFLIIVLFIFNPVFANDLSYFKIPSFSFSDNNLDDTDTGLDLMRLEKEELVKRIEYLKSMISAMSSEAGGGWSGNGGDFNLQSDNIWFLGVKPINYCVLGSVDYKIDKLDQLVENSINSWLSFFNKYKIDNNSLDRSNGFEFVDGIDRKITLKFNKVECSEDQTNLDDGIIFLFGKKTPLVEAYKQLTTENAYGLAIRQKYDHKTFRNRGVVWIENFSDERARVKHMLLHELGHVFGMKHDSVFVVDEKIVYQLQKKRFFQKKFFGVIESAQWLYKPSASKEIIITNNKGMRFLRSGRRKQIRNRLMKKCKNSDFLPNMLMDSKIRRHFKFRLSDCYSVKLVKDSNNMFKLIISELKSQKMLVLKAKIDATDSNKTKQRAPGIFTLWKKNRENGSTILKWRKRTFDTLNDVFPALGFFENEETGVQYPAKVSSDKGVSVQLYIPSVKKWWNPRGMKLRK